MSDAPAPVTMAFTHLCAWRVIGGIGMPADAGSVPLASGVGWSYSLSKDIDAVCADSDRVADGFIHVHLRGQIAQRIMEFF